MFGFMGKSRAHAVKDLSSTFLVELFEVLVTAYVFTIYVSRMACTIHIARIAFYDGSALRNTQARLFILHPRAIHDHDSWPCHKQDCQCTEWVHF